VAAGVQQHVGDCVPHLARRPQDPHVGAIGEHPARVPEDAVRGAREARGDRLQPARQVAGARGLDDQVRVVGLDAVVDEAEAPALAGRPPAALELGDEARAAQRGKVRAHLQRDVAGMACGEGGASPMRIAPLRPGLAAGAGPRPAPARGRAQIEHELSRASPSHARERHLCV
jgi:hypothetical protein